MRTEAVNSAVKRPLPLYFPVKHGLPALIALLAREALPKPVATRGGNERLPGRIGIGIVARRGVADRRE